MRFPGRSRSHSNFIRWQGMLYHAIVAKNEVIDDNTRCGGPIQARMSVAPLQSTWSLICCLSTFLLSTWALHASMAISDPRTFTISFIGQATAVSESRWIYRPICPVSRLMISFLVRFSSFDSWTNVFDWLFAYKIKTKCIRFLHKICFLTARKIGQQGTNK